MATYSELREEILYTLDVPPAMTGDVRSLVDIKMAGLVERLVSEIMPLQLITRAGPVVLTSATTSVPMGAAGFDCLTTYAQVITFTIDKDTTDETPPEVYEYVPYQTWLTQNSVRAGDNRGGAQFTINPSLEVEIKNWPDGSDTWSSYLWYLSRPAAVSDLLEPELPPLKQRIVVPGVAVQFPHLFQGDRQTLLFQQQKQFDDLYRELLRNRDIALRQLALRLSPTNAVPSRSFFWPTSRVSP
jgi:hypothetical protein